MECQNCGADLPLNPHEAVENGRLSEVVAHTFDPDGVAIAATDYYCGPDCAAEAFRGDA